MNKITLREGRLVSVLLPVMVTSMMADAQFMEVQRRRLMGVTSHLLITEDVAIGVASQLPFTRDVA